MQAPKETIQNKYLQHPTTILWTCSTAAAVVVGHENGNNLYKFFNYSSLFAFVRKLCLTMFMFMFLGLSFLHVWCLKLFCFLQTEALPPANGKSFLWIFQKARRRRHFWAFGLSLKEHCFHQVESNLKTRHYEYAFDFEGYSIYSFVLMFSFFIFIYYLFSKRQYVFISWKTMIINTNLYFFCIFYFILPFLYVYI